MRIRFAALVATTFIAVPALAGDVEIYQTGRSNWAVANQYNSSNYAMVHQRGVDAYGNNYAAFDQRGRRNEVNAAQSSYTDNALGITQTGRDNYVTAWQSAAGFNGFSVTQNRLRRR